MRTIFAQPDATAMADQLETIADILSRQSPSPPSSSSLAQNLEHEHLETRRDEQG